MCSRLASTPLPLEPLDPRNWTAKPTFPARPKRNHLPLGNVPVFMRSWKPGSTLLASNAWPGSRPAAHIDSKSCPIATISLRFFSALRWAGFDLTGGLCDPTTRPTCERTRREVR